MRISALVHAPMPRRLVTALSADAGSRAARSIEVRRAAACTIVRDCGGSSPARCHVQLGMRCQSAGGANIGRGVGPGARSPHQVRIIRQAPKACSPVTFCSNTALISASKTRSVRPSRRSPCR
jgi:hypothetical protein